MIPVCEPLIGGNALRYVSECIETGWISSEGGFVRRLEADWAAYCGCAHGVAVNSGTAALAVAVAALDLPPGSEIIVPSFTIISCVTAIIEAGCVPVLVDAEPDTFNMNLAEAAAKITPRTRAIMPVHMFGHPVDMDAVGELAAKHDLRVVEDAAEAHGARWRGKVVGGIGDLGCFSFYANKIISTGEGGMVVTNDGRLADRVRSLRNLCFKPERRFLHDEIGHNYRLTNVQAAIGVSQVEMVEDLVARRRALAAAYTERLSAVPGLTLPVERDGAYNVYWMYCLMLDDEVPFEAAEFARRLRELGIETRPMFLGMHEQPVLQARGLFAGERYPVAERIARRGLYVPSGGKVSPEQVEQVCDAVRRALA